MPATSLKLAMLVVGASVAGFSQSASIHSRIPSTPAAAARRYSALTPSTEAVYLTDTVLASQRTDYQFSGTPNDQAGLSLLTIGVVNPLSYSSEEFAHNGHAPA